jgi:membrane protein GlpM
MDIIWKGIAGRLVTAAIVWLPGAAIPCPGILPLFPTFTLIAPLIVGAKGDHAGFREA